MDFVTNLLTFYRPIDTLTTFQLGKTGTQQSAPVRYAVRQVLHQELRRETMLQHTAMRNARSSSLSRGETAPIDDDKENEGSKNSDKPFKHPPGTKRDFFGRIVNEVRPIGSNSTSDVGKKCSRSETEAQRVWVSFHEGYSNAVRKPITLKELIESFELP